MLYLAEAPLREYGYHTRGAELRRFSFFASFFLLVSGCQVMQLPQGPCKSSSLIYGKMIFQGRSPKNHRGKQRFSKVALKVRFGVLRVFPCYRAFEVEHHLALKARILQA